MRRSVSSLPVELKDAWRTALRRSVLATVAFGAFAFFGVTVHDAQAASGHLQANFGPVEQAMEDCGYFTALTDGSGIGVSQNCPGDVGLTLSAAKASHQAVGYYSLNAPTGITINQVNAALTFSSAKDGSSYEYEAGDHWAGGGDMHWTPGQRQTSTIDSTSNVDSSWWNFWLSCTTSGGCGGAAKLQVGGVVVQATETSAPSLIAAGANNLFYQGGRWIWNPAGDPWSSNINGADPSGVCAANVEVNQGVVGDVKQAPLLDSGWQQCPQLALVSSVDTQRYAHNASANIQLALGDTNAAGNSSSASTTLKIDNVPPTALISTLNDSNPGGWAVNHAVTVHVTPEAGPSGVSSTTCTLDGAPASLDGADDFTVDGNGQHSISCSVANGAIDPQGQPNTGSSSMTVDIDEQAPSLSFDPADPDNPDQVVVATSDDESAVAGGSIQLAPAGSSSWRSLPTSLTSGGQLIATVPDAGMHGAYVIKATACSQVGNCGDVTEPVTLPLRVSAQSEISFAPVSVPTRVVVRRVLVGFHYARIRRHHRIERRRVGGHIRIVRIVVRSHEVCTSHRVRVGRRRSSRERVCRAPEPRVDRRRTVAFGRRVTVHGLVLSRQGVPISGAQVTVATAPLNGLGQFVRIAEVRTDAAGVWSLRVPAGPSRVIRATYVGSRTELPAVGTATVAVPARIALTGTPRQLAWSGVVTFTGRLLGGYVPPDGVALRLLVRYPGAVKLTPLVALRTDRRGEFSIQWSYNAGRGSATYPFYIATTAAESDYPFAPSRSRAVAVSFGP